MCMCGKLCHMRSKWTPVKVRSEGIDRNGRDFARTLFPIFHENDKKRRGSLPASWLPPYPHPVPLPEGEVNLVYYRVTTNSCFDRSHVYPLPLQMASTVFQSRPSPFISSVR
jgi:hypothetical protein